MGALLLHSISMYHYAHTPTNYHQQGVTQHTDLGRYEKSPPPTQRSFSVNTRKGTNGAPFREDVTLILRQQPKEALVTTDGKEKGKHIHVVGKHLNSFVAACASARFTDSQQHASRLIHRPSFKLS